MRWVLALILGFGWVASASAEVPQQLHYNGYLTNAAGESVNCPDPIQCGESFELSFRIYSSEEDESPIWTELEVDVPIYNGSFHVILGDSTSLDASVLNGEAWVGVKVNDHAEMNPRQKILSAAYAIRAGTVDNAESLNGLTAEDFVSVSSLADLQAAVEANDNDALAQLACTPGQVPKWNGGAWVCTEDADTQLDEAEVDAFVTNNGYASNLDLSALQESFNTLNSEVATLQMTSSALICSVGQVTKWNGSFWACADDIDTTIPDTNTQLSEVEVDGMVANNGYAAQSELEAAQNALTALQTLVSDLQTSTGADVSALQDQITALEAVITTLQTNLAAEATARSDADNAEAATRSNKDLELGSALIILQDTTDTLEVALSTHHANPNAHHPADSAGLHIVPASVTIGGSSTSLNAGTVDLGAETNDHLSAAMVQSLAHGGNADSLHTHAASSAASGPTMMSLESPDNMKFMPAVRYCRDLNEDGFDDWRLPIFAEVLKVYTETSVNNDESPNAIWTATRYGVSDLAVMSLAGWLGANWTGAEYHVRCVR